MRGQDKYYIPQFIDQPFRVFLLTLDELLLLVVPIVIIGFVVQQMMIGFIVGIGSLMLVKKFKGEQGHYYLVHLAYWYLPEVIKLKVTPPSYIRRYLG